MTTDPNIVTLRDYVDGTNGTHNRAHDIEHQAIKVAFDNYLRELGTYRSAHDSVHNSDKLAVRTALDAVDRLAQLHAAAHEREHLSHEMVHQREREAAGLARVELDARMKESAQQRQQLHDQQATSMSRTETTDKFAAIQAQIDKLNIAAASNNGASQRTVYLFGTGLALITVVITIITFYLGSK